MVKRIGVGLIAVAILGYFMFLGTKKEEPKKVFNKNISYKVYTYKPYDIKYAFDRFNKSSKKGFEINNEKADYINKKLYAQNKLLVVCSPYFLPNKDESEVLLNFVDRGNNLFISSFNISPAFLDTLLLLEEKSAFYQQWPPVPYVEDSITINWFEADSTLKFTYPGYAVTNYSDIYFNQYDSLKILARDQDTTNAFIDIPVGSGHFYILLRPMTMTNYFLLHKQNYQFLNLILNKIDAKNKTVIWDDFYRNHPHMRPDGEPDKPGDSYFWDLIMKSPPLKWAVFTFIFGLILFILIYSRRVQRASVVLPEIKNTSYEFTKALAGLYWLNQDHKKIAEKIISQFHDYLHSKFRIFPKDLTMENVQKIAQKTGKHEEDLRNILVQIEEINEQEKITNKTLITFYTDVFKYIN